MRGKRQRGMSVEDAMEKLEKIVKQLEEGILPLEESIRAFSEGMELARFCQKKLDEVQAKVQKLMHQDGGGWKSEPYDETSLSSSGEGGDGGNNTLS